MRVLLLGGSGLLGTELRKLNEDIICPTSEDCNIRSLIDVEAILDKHEPDIVIHAAAMTDNRQVEKEVGEAIYCNIVGTAHVSMACINKKIRLVYISTDYVYKGDRGNYKETDELLPFNLYSWTKLGGECSVVGVENHLIIRTSFGKRPFEYKEAFTDKWTSKDYVEVIAPMIYEAATSSLTGVLNLGTERKTLYTYGSQTATVKGVKLSETNFFTPADTSLNTQKWIDFKTDNPTAVVNKKCRACGSDKLEKYLDLGLMPLPNNLAFTASMAKVAPRYPLQVALCLNCSHSQLTVDVSPVKMFSHYLYRSSINKPYIDHCRQMAKDLKKEFNLNSECFHIDIAGNDGALLKEFKDEIGLKVLNVDPASNLTAIGEAEGIASLSDFWNTTTAEFVVNKHGRADLITATNVFAHVPDMQDFLIGARVALKSSGILVIECPYLVDLIEKMEYDTVYAEHASYISISPINQMCERLGLRIINVEKQAIHGGTVRMTIAHDRSQYVTSRHVAEFILNEKLNGYDAIENYKKWNLKVRENISQFGRELLTLKKQGYKIAGMGASAKGNTLLNTAKINTDIMSYIIDETPQKIGLFSPGTGIEVVGMDILERDTPDYICILAWNFADVLIDKLRAKGYEGKIIVPIPKFVIL